MVFAPFAGDLVDSIGKRVITLEKGRVIRDDKDGKYMI